MHHQATPTHRTLAVEIRELSGINPARCYQCGKCSAGCPMAAETSQRPHDVLRLILRDERARLFDDTSIWLCLTCETCTARCPNDVDPARIIDAARELAWRSHRGEPPRAIRAFHTAFLDEIEKHGRVFEMGLVAGFKMRGGGLFADVEHVPGLLKRGKLGLRPERVAGLADVRRIFAACREDGSET